MPNSKFYATGGRGTESFIAEEISKKLSVERKQITVRDGKVFFEIIENKQIQNIFQLKSPERVFVSIIDYSNESFFHNKKLFLDKLMHEIADPLNFSVTKVILGMVDTFQNINLPHTKRKCDHLGESEHIVKSMRTSLDHKTLCSSNRPEKSDSACSESKKKNEIIDSDDNKLSDLDLKKNISTSRGEHSKSYVQEEDNGTSESKSEKKTFRISIKCSGKLKRKMDVDRLSKDVAWRVARATGWICCLRSPSIEVCIHISNNFVTAGVPLSQEPFSKRKFIKDSGLRSSICWIMTHLAQIKQFDRVLDPFCGKGTLLLEAFSVQKEAYYFGIDIDKNQITIAQSNVKAAQFEDHFQLMEANCKDLPFLKHSFDVVLCDVPFGQNHTIDSETAVSFYCKVLHQISRVLTFAGKCILLTSQSLCLQLRSMFLKEGRESCGSTNGLLNMLLISEHYVKLGETDGTIMVLKNHGEIY